VSRGCRVGDAISQEGTLHALTVTIMPTYATDLCPLSEDMAGDENPLQSRIAIALDDTHVIM
jgi:hypothetical protein